MCLSLQPLLSSLAVPRPLVWSFLGEIFFKKIFLVSHDRRNQMGSHCSQSLVTAESSPEGDADRRTDAEPVAQVQHNEGAAVLANVPTYSTTTDETAVVTVRSRDDGSQPHLNVVVKQSTRNKKPLPLRILINPAQFTSVDFGGPDDEMPAHNQCSAPSSPLISPKCFTSIADSYSPSPFKAHDLANKDRGGARALHVSPTINPSRCGLRNNPLEPTTALQCDVTAHESVMVPSFNTPRNRRCSMEATGQQHDDAHSRRHSTSSQSARVSFHRHAVVLMGDNEVTVTTDSASTSITSFSFAPTTPTKAAMGLNPQISSLFSVGSSAVALPSTTPNSSSACPHDVKRGHCVAVVPAPTCLVPAVVPLRSVAVSTESRLGGENVKQLSEPVGSPEPLDGSASTALPSVESTAGHLLYDNESSSSLRYIPILPEEASHRNQLAKKGHFLF